MTDPVCPACGGDDLRGEPAGELLRITCQACGEVWDRDPRPRCPTCGGDRLEEAAAAIVERSRGSQLSIVGTRPVHLCLACDAEAVETYRLSRRPLMPKELPTT